jgi:hypothetical protein
MANPTELSGDSPAVAWLRALVSDCEATPTHLLPKLTLSDLAAIKAVLARLKLAERREP